MKQLNKLNQRIREVERLMASKRAAYWWDGGRYGFIEWSYEGERKGKFEFAE